MALTTPFPEPASPQLERFAVDSRSEILAVLHALLQRAQPITAFAEAGAAGVVLRPVACDEASGVIAFAAEADDARLPAARPLTFVGFLDGVKLQFTAEARPWANSERTGLAVPVPRRLYRLQRRRAERLGTSPGPRAVCRVPRADGSGFDVFVVLDLGRGGVALGAPAGCSVVEVGQRLDGCRLDLPGVGGVGVALRVRHVSAARGSGRRIGCEFEALTPAAAGALARFAAKGGGTGFPALAGHCVRPPA
jgi:c-di-GMP-binding flagellar brake protein YcgR